MPKWIKTSCHKQLENWAKYKKQTLDNRQHTGWWPHDFLGICLRQSPACSGGAGGVQNMQTTVVLLGWGGMIRVQDSVAGAGGGGGSSKGHTQIDGIRRQDKGDSTEKGKSWQQKIESTNHKNKVDKLERLGESISQANSWERTWVQNIWRIFTTQ